MRHVKEAIILFLLGISIIAASAVAADLPGYMRDGKIVVTLKDGKSYEFSVNEYMVVRRGSGQAKAEQQAEEVAPRKQAEEGPVAAGPNAVKVYGGVGPSDLKVATGATSVTIDQDYGPVLGLGYSRQLSRRISLDAVGLSNKTGLLGLGYSF